MVTLNLQMNSLDRPMKRHDVSTIETHSKKLGYPVETTELLVRFEEISVLSRDALLVGFIMRRLLI